MAKSNPIPYPILRQLKRRPLAKHLAPSLSRPADAADERRRMEKDL